MKSIDSFLRKQFTWIVYIGFVFTQLLNAQSTLLQIVRNYDELKKGKQFMEPINTDIQTIRIILTYQLTDNMTEPEEAVEEKKQSICDPLIGKSFYLQVREENSTQVFYVKGTIKIKEINSTLIGGIPKRYRWIDYIDFNVNINASLGCNPTFEIIIEDSQTSSRQTIADYKCINSAIAKNPIENINSQTGTLDISVSPSEAADAQVYLNEELIPKGRAPLQLSLKPSYYNVIAKKQGFYDATQTILLSKNGFERVYFNMVRIQEIASTKNNEWKWLTGGLAIVGYAAASYFYNKSWDNQHSLISATDQTSANNFQTQKEANKSLYYLSISGASISLSTFLMLLLNWL